jgi:large subunit ribosomal protein L21
MSSYAIISLGGKQYRVHEGERLLVDRLRADEGATVEPRVLLIGGNGAPDLAPSTTVTARVVGHELGAKIRIGKYRRRTGYKRHAGHRSKLTRIEIESIGAGGAKRSKTAAKPKADEKPNAAEKPAATTDKAAATGPDLEAMTIPQITKAAAGWSRDEIEAAIAQERSGKARKGALAALESALEDN